MKFYMYSIFKLMDFHATAVTYEQGRTCKEFMGGVLDTRDRLFTKIVLQRHHATHAQTYISILLADATYFYHHCFQQFLLLRKWQS